MSAAEERDRLGDRFRLLVGSRRGLERYHTLRHAVLWSYDLLENAEKALLKRCWVFARKSLLVADRSSGRTRFSMLEIICEFADDACHPNGWWETG